MKVFIRTIATVGILVPLVMGFGWVPASPLLENTTRMTAATNSNIQFHVVSEDRVPADVQAWVENNKQEPCTLYKNSGGKTYLLISRGMQAGARGVKINSIRKSGAHLTVFYHNVDPKPGQIESYMMTTRFILVELSKVSGHIEFIKLGSQLSL